MNIVFAYSDAESIGVQSLMGVLIEAGHNVEFVYYSVDDSYTNYKNANVDYGAIAREIADHSPEIVGLSCVSDNLRYQLNVAYELKKISNAVVILGGVYPTLLPQKTLEHPEVDAVAVGEAEVSLPAWIDSGAQNGKFTLPDTPTRGITHKNNGSIVGNYQIGELPDLDKLPFLHKEPFMDHLPEVQDEYRLMTSRGCPYVCTYCAYSYTNAQQKKRMVRQASVDRIIKELVNAKEKYGISYVLINDDCFATNTSWLEEFSEKYRSEVGLPFVCMTSPLQLNEKKMDYLKNAGCVSMQIGIQSLSEQLCEEVLQRKSSNKKIQSALQGLRERNILIQVDHMLGIPEDSIENQEEALAFFSDYRPDLVSVFWLKYYPKSKIIQHAVSKGILTTADVEKIENCESVNDSTIMMRGSSTNPDPYYPIAFLLNWLPITPSFIIRALVRTRLYRIFRIKSYYIVVALPRAIKCLLDRRDFRGRQHLKRYFHSFFSNRFLAAPKS